MMPLVGVTGSLAGGVVTSLQSTVTINDVAVLVAGSTVASHGDTPHEAATMSIPDPARNFTINNVAVIVYDDPASCGDTISTTAPNAKVTWTLWVPEEEEEEG